MKNKTKILIVDDDTGMTETLSDILTDLGHCVEIANNGLDAIETVKVHAFDTVLLDIKMPGINGVETFKEIKKVRPEAMVILMTAHSVEGLAAEALGEEAYCIMYKPIDTKRLAEFIETAKRGGLILLVDIDLSTSQKVIDALKKTGCRITQARSDGEARDFVQKKTFDMVFIEAKMPVMNCLETYMALRKIRSNVKVVMTTYYREGLEDSISQAIRDGAYASIYKPFDVGKVAKLLERIMVEKTKPEIRKMEDQYDRKS